jgi:hypothetical protein
MSTINQTAGRLLAGVGGALLLASLFATWSEEAGMSRNGFETVGVLDVFLVITGLSGVAAGTTGGRAGFFRRDLSVGAMADIFGVVATILIGWLLLFDFPAGSDAQLGVYLALLGAAAVAAGAGDFRVTSLFPSIPGETAPGTRRSSGGSDAQEQVWP